MSVINRQIVHVVLFKWNEDATPGAIRSAVEALLALADKIPGVLELTCGKNFSDRNQGYTHGMVVRFIDRAALEAYGPHPAHQHVVQNFISPIRADVLVVDYEAGP